MAKNKSHHSKMRQASKASPNGLHHQYNKDQLEKLYLDSCGFWFAAKVVNERMKKTDVEFASRLEISLTTTAMVNLGLALELLMKYLLALTGCKIPHTHSLASLHNQMSQELRNELSTAYFQHLKDNSPKEDLFRASLRSTTMPESPPQFHIETLRGFLKYIDQIGAYDKRYSFEKFSQNEWWIRVDIDWLLGLTNAFVRVANRYRSQDDEEIPDRDLS